MINYKSTPSWYEYIIFKFLTKEFKAFIDIGVGPKTEYLVIKKKFPKVPLFGVEANPDTYNLIKDVFPGKVFNRAISESGEPVDFYIHKENTMASGLIPYDNTKDNIQKITVPSQTLDGFFQEIGEPDGCLMWMDIEGYELKALRSAPRMLVSGKIKWLNIEVRNRWNNKSNACTESEIDRFLEIYGYKKIFSYNHYPSSRHHDSIYVHKTISIPTEGKHWMELYTFCNKKIETEEGRQDIALGLIDAAITIAERDSKINYLRAQLAALQK